MAICPECKEKIKEGATVCKHCGKKFSPNVGKTGCAIVAGAIAIFFIIPMMCKKSTPIPKHNVTYSITGDAGVTVDMSYGDPTLAPMAKSILINDVAVPWNKEIAFDTDGNKKQVFLYAKKKSGKGKYTISIVCDGENVGSETTQSSSKELYFEKFITGY